MSLCMWMLHVLASRSFHLFSFPFIFLSLFYFYFVLDKKEKKKEKKRPVLLMVGDKMAHRIGQLGVRLQRKAFLRKLRKKPSHLSFLIFKGTENGQPPYSQSLANISIVLMEMDVNKVVSLVNKHINSHG